MASCAGRRSTWRLRSSRGTDLGQLALRRFPDAPLLRRCWELREVCTTYDALYVALAEALDAKLVTRDVRLGVSGLVDVLATP